MSLFLWVFPAFNILDYGYATLDLLFNVAPMILMVLIPAITMRSFAEETREGTIEFLSTRPVKDIEIILGKYFASLFLVFFAILPTLVYYFSVYQLGMPKGNLDTGGVIGSYVGLILLSAGFVAIGIFSSALSNDQIVAFIISLVVGAFFYLGFKFGSTIPAFYGKFDDMVESLGMNYHYTSLSRGLIDSRDVLYFVSLSAAFIFGTKLILEKRKW